MPLFAPFCRLMAALLFVLAASAPAAKAEEPQPRNTKPAPSAEQLERWSQQLDAPEFLERENAMLGLQSAGAVGLPAVKAALDRGSLEAISRGLFILRQVGLSSDPAAQEQAWDLLVEAAGRRETPALARRASAALLELKEQRSAQSLAELQLLGARLERPDFFGGLAWPEPVESIEIGPAFAGSADDLRRLKWLEDIPSLILAGPKATDAWVEQAAKMPNLRQLHLYQTSVTDDALASLHGHQFLEQVGLYYTPLGDKLLKSLETMPALKFVKLFSTDVTSEAAETLIAKGVAIDRRRGAFLGVGASAIDESCLISKVHQGSPAEKAGLLIDDVIVGFGGAKIANFDALTARIARCSPGEEVQVEVQRQTVDDSGNTTLRTVATPVKLAP